MTAGRAIGRRALGAAPAALLLPRSSCAAAGQHPDQPLLDACAEFNHVVARIENCFAGGETPIPDEAERDRFLEPFRERESELIGLICTLRARTPAGLHARAASIAKWDPTVLRVADDEDGCQYKRLVAATVRDLVAAGSAG